MPEITAALLRVKKERLRSATRAWSRQQRRVEEAALAYETKLVQLKRAQDSLPIREQQLFEELRQRPSSVNELELARWTVQDMRAAILKLSEHCQELNGIHEEMEKEVEKRRILMVLAQRKQQKLEHINSETEKEHRKLCVMRQERQLSQLCDARAAIGKER